MAKNAYNAAVINGGTVRNQEVKSVLRENYLPYAMSVITSRAIPDIDGLKPAHRHVLYTMFKMGLLKGDKTKSANIVGQTMKLHPHGDAAIYETMVRMTTGNGSLNVPYVESKGSMGRVESRDMAYAAPRYTEAKLAPICEEMFSGIDENAVDLVDNYDATEKEPVRLPVKFPSVLVNTAPGIAVGMSSSVPSYNLRDVCNATIGVMKGEIEDEVQLHSVLGAPDYSTGGTVHGSDRDFINILKSGRGSIVMSGTVTLDKNRIVVTEVPYSTSIEAIIDDVEKYVKSGELKEVSDIRDESDLHGTRICIDLKRGSNVEETLKKIYKYTRLRTSMGVNNNILIDGTPMTLSVLNTIKEWVKFRVNTVKRVYEYRLEKALEKEHLLSAWELIKDNLARVIEIITKNNEVLAKSMLMAEFKLDDVQATYVMNLRLKDITADRAAKRIAELQEIRNSIVDYRNIISDDSKKYKLIIEELSEIARKYGRDRRTVVSEVPIDDKIEKVVDSRDVYVYITKQGYIKRIENIRNKGLGVMADEKIYQDDEVEYRFFTKNNEYLLIFTYDGKVFKIPVIDIESSKGLAKETIQNLVGESIDVMYISPSNGFIGHLNVVYNNGKGYTIHFSRLAGKRKKYISVYDAGNEKTMWATEEDKMFLITYKKKAAYAEIIPVANMSGRSAFKIARMPSDDSVFGLQPASLVPNFNEVDTSIYNKGYFVKIKHPLW